jgi:hypothetical protein
MGLFHSDHGPGSFKRIILCWKNELCMNYSHRLKILNSYTYETLPVNIYLFNFAVGISASKALGSGTNGSAVCTSFYLPNITDPIYIQ